MSTAVDAINTHKRPGFPTEDAPERGVASLFDVRLSEADYFVEAGDHVIRSREFDVIAAGGSFDEALQNFNAAILDFAIYLGELEQRAENEEEMFHVIAPRLMRIIQAIERHEAQVKRARRRFLGLSISRLRNEEDGPEWLPSSRRAGSSVPSLA